VSELGPGDEKTGGWQGGMLSDVERRQWRFGESLWVYGMQGKSTGPTCGGSWFSGSVWRDCVREALRPARSSGSLFFGGECRDLGVPSVFFCRFGSSGSLIRWGIGWFSGAFMGYP
jgi:hypothetical protein